ncbi:MAG: transposase [Anaerolineae bacterium]|nr:transposase [Anaerolineae bacterium]
MTREFKKLSHSIYECKYHIVFCPKYRYRVLRDDVGNHVKRVFNRFEHLRQRYRSGHLWSRGYCVSTIGLDEEKIRRCVKWQEAKDRADEAHQRGLFD